MLHVRVAGARNSGKTSLITIIETALRAKSKRCLVVDDEDTRKPKGPGDVDVVITSVQLTKPSTEKNFNFLVGRTEAEAYELAQDQGAVVRVASRNGIPMHGKHSFPDDCLELVIVNNIVVSWS
jgi:energy-coupling factor transporter ATP-binding protein EcfA2